MNVIYTWVYKIYAGVMLLKKTKVEMNTNRLYWWYLSVLYNWPSLKSTKFMSLEKLSQELWLSTILTCETHSMIEAMDNVDMCDDIATSLVVCWCSNYEGNWLICYASSPELMLYALW